VPRFAVLMSALGQKQDIAGFIWHPQQCSPRCELDRSQFRPPTYRRQEGSCRGTPSLRGREVGHFHLIHLLKNMDGNHFILQSLPRFLLLLSHDSGSDLL
jgi:hypothetical protein